MYIPKKFEIKDQNKIFDFINRNAFGQLITQHDGSLNCTHMPFLLSDDHKYLLGHLAVQNPQYSGVSEQDVLVTLTGEHGYISPSWYESPGVPTWNYQAVHINGSCAVFTDGDRIKNVVDALTDKYESSLESSWQPEYSSRLLKAIVGIEISIDSIQCKYKLSQNRSTGDTESVINNLQRLGATALSNAMRDELS